MNAMRHTTMAGLVCCAVLGWTSPLSAQVLGGSLGGTLNGGFAGGPGIMGGTLNGGVQGRASGAMGTSIDPTASSGAVRERATRVTQSARQRIATSADQTTSAAASTVQGARADAQWTADAGTTAAVSAADQANGNVTSTGAPRGAGN